MARASTDREIEIKLRLTSVAAGKRLLRRLGFSIVRRRAFEVNVILDTADGALRRGRHLLRLRQSGHRHTLTFKRPPAAGRPKEPQGTRARVGAALPVGRLP